MRRGKRGLREQAEIVDNVDKSVQNSIFPKKGRKWVCKTYPQNWGQNVDNVDNKKAEHIFCATCLVYHKVGRLEEEKTFYLDRQGFYSRHPEQDRSRVAFREVPETS